MCFAPQRRALFRHLHFQKSLRRWGVLPLFTSKCASRHNGVHFFHISTSKSRPRPTCFVHFWLPKCASRHNGVHFFHISTSKSRPKVRCFALFTSKCASRHNGVHFFNISTSKSGLRMDVFWHFLLQNVLRATTACNFSSLQKSGQLPPHPCRFSEPTFRPSGATKHIGKTQCFATFPTFFAHLHLLPLLTFSISYLLPSDFLHVRVSLSSDFLHLWSSPSLIFSLLTFSTSEFLPGCAFHLSILSEVSLLNFLR